MVDGAREPGEQASGCFPVCRSMYMDIYTYSYTNTHTWLSLTTVFLAAAKTVKWKSHFECDLAVSHRVNHGLTPKSSNQVPQVCTQMAWMILSIEELARGCCYQFTGKTQNLLRAESSPRNPATGAWMKSPPPGILLSDLKGWPSKSAKSDRLPSDYVDGKKMFGKGC